MSPLDRTIAAMERVTRFAHVVPPREALVALAKWHLAEVRRARGRAISNAIASPVYAFNGIVGPPCGWDIQPHEGPINQRMTEAMGKRVARVVLVTKRRKAGR